MRDGVESKIFSNCDLLLSTIFESLNKNNPATLQTVFMVLCFYDHMVLNFTDFAVYRLQKVGKRRSRIEDFQ